MTHLAQAIAQPQPPVMGWSSWNHFRIHINEKMIREQADAMVASGLYAAGYRYINIDDGFFGGRDSSGRLLAHPEKFPSGMKALADYIHGKGLKAGIYSDAGRNTCGSIWDKDNLGLGVGLYGYVAKDCELFFREWKYDFFKVDWCGGQQMKLQEEITYTHILETVKKINPAIVFNICRWQFPGSWAIKKADSWRISGDIEAGFSSILHIIDLNADLYPYASPGHYNDMDMLQVGRGMSFEEDKSHFSMWCMLNSPLLAGNDLRNMSSETLSILTNRRLIAINQDLAQVQAKRIARLGTVDIWKKKLTGTNTYAVAMLNRGDRDTTMALPAEIMQLTPHTLLENLWETEKPLKVETLKRVTIPAHGILVWKAMVP